MGFEELGEFLESAGDGGVAAGVMQHAEEFGDDGRLALGLADEALQRVGGAAAELVIVERRAGGADDAAVGEELLVAEAVIQGGEELAHRQVAGGAEDDVVEGIHGFDLHGGS